MKTRSQKLVRVALIIGGTLVAVVVLGLLFTKATGSPIVCGSCHEMAPALATWKTSGHTNVGCPSCHEKPRAWYQFPQTLATRTAMLGRDINAHFSDQAAADVAAAMESTPTVSDQTCLKCHDLSRTVTMRFGTLINHSEHAKRNNSCVSCHLWTAHPPPGSEKPMLLMERCFTCHGRTASAKAPGTCDTCHPKSFSLRPASHKPADQWRTKHGKVALAKGQPCEMCHEKSFCQSCHGLVMPHPANWAKGNTPLHAAVAQQNVQVCSKCHGEGRTFCTMCHHRGYDPAQGPWLRQHPVMVAQRGASFCIECHEPTFCVKCHLSGMPPDSATAGS